MDDGHLKKGRNNDPKKVILSTESFTIKENKKLIDFIEKRYHLTFRLDGQRRLVLYDQFQILYFLYLIRRYLHPSMHSKFISKHQIYFDPRPRRTTLYLSEIHKINRPTREINDMLQNLDTLIQLYKNNTFYENNIPYLKTLQHENKSYQIIIAKDELE